MIQAFIFDLGKVIVPFEIEKGLKNLEGKCDLPIEFVREEIFASEANVLFHTGKISALEFYDLMKTSLKLRLDFEEFVFVWNSIFSLNPIISEHLIQELSEKYRLLILSDTNELHIDFIKPRFPILQYFDEFVLSHKVGALKPSPKMYQAAVEKAECLPQECFFTDDKLENVEGARKFGINAVQFISAEQFEYELKGKNLF